jgi:hypothetical protein
MNTRRRPVAWICRFFVLGAIFGILHAVHLSAQEMSLKSLDQYFDEGLELVNDQKVREAITLLKEAKVHYPDSGAVSRLLARAYLIDNNRFWALKVLREHAQKTGDCETLTWIAWMHLQNGDLDRAESVLHPDDVESTGYCMGEDLVAARWSLLLAMLSHFQSDPKSTGVFLRTARRNKTIFPEDRQLLRYLNHIADPGWLQPIQFRIEQAVGWDSNALLASANEVRDTDQEIASDLMSNTHEIRFVLPLLHFVRPDLEYRGRWKEYLKDAAKDYSLYEMNYRAGLLLGAASPRLGLYYSGQDLLYNGSDKYDDGPRWFYEAHRGEVEIDAAKWLFIFGGAGRRIFRERARTRDEFDGGLALRFGLPYKLSFTAIGSGRYYDAQIEAYNDRGGTLLGAIHIPYYRDGYFRIGGSWSKDEYPDSRDYFEQGEKRSDVMQRFFPAVWSPSYRHFRVGATWQYSARDSSIDQYSYNAHEVLFKMSFKWDFNPWEPSTAKTHNHTKLSYGLSFAAQHDQRMQDLLRQEDAAQRSSSCVD